MKYLYSLILAGILCSGVQESLYAQRILSRLISIAVSEKALGDVLTIIAEKGNFNFSYNGLILSRDSLVTMNVKNYPVSDVLSQIFKNKYAFEERNGFLIIIPAAQRLAVANLEVNSDQLNYSISGFIINNSTGEKIAHASVYEKQLLASVLTDELGYFNLKLRNSSQKSVVLTVSKQFYLDTAMHIMKPVLISGTNWKNFSGYETSKRSVEGSAFGNLFVSARQKIQSLNIPLFFANSPFQVSLTPGLSTHGMFSPQVINKFSLNIGGGYTAGVNGIEFGGLFNINRNNVKYLQLAGIFNLVGGSVKGLQAAALHNTTLDSVKGVQLAGAANHTDGQVSGLQFSVFHNYARKLKGIQIGLVNAADSSAGFSLGLVNIIRNGKYRLSVSANDLMNTNLSFKTGTNHFYSMVLGGTNISQSQKMSAIGFGAGFIAPLNPSAFLIGEMDYQLANSLGSWDDLWLRYKLLLSVKLSDKTSLFAGPSFNRYNRSGTIPTVGRRNIEGIEIYRNGIRTGHQLKKWTGWEAGLLYTNSFKPAKVKISQFNYDSWYLSISASAGILPPVQWAFVYGTHIQVNRELGTNLEALLSSGFTFFKYKYVSRSWRSDGSSYTDTFYGPFQYVPVKAGIRIGKSLYGTAETGVGFGIKTPSGLILATSLGYSFRNGLDVSSLFENYGNYTGKKQLALRLAYRFKLGS